MGKKSRIGGLNIKNTGIDGIIQPTEPEQKTTITEEIARINFDVPSSLKKRVQFYCLDKDISIKDFFIEVASKYLDGNI